MIDWLNPSEEMLAGLQAGREEANSMHTEAELKEAVQAEREAIIIMLNDYIDDDNYSLEKLIEAIRKRGE